MGATHIRLSAANKDVLTGALRTAWMLRVEKKTKGRPAVSKRPIKSEP
jgi:hypothetical protein